MPSHRTLRLLLILGLILAIAGVAALAYSTQLPEQAGVAPIPAGWEFYNEVHWAFLDGGTIQGTFQEANNTPVNVLVYNDADYNAFVNTDNRTPIVNVTEASGTISLSVSGFDTYHVVFQHPPGYENVSQNVTVDFTATGMDPTFAVGGIAVIAIGGLLVAYSVLRSRRTATAGGPLPSRATIPMPPPTGPDMSTGSGTYRVPPPLPGDAAGAAGLPVSQAAAASTPSQESVGTVVVTVVNGSGADAAFDLVVNGAAVTSMNVPAGQTQTLSVSARLSSPFGSTVTVEAVMAGGGRTRQAVFVGAKGSAPVTLRIG